MENVGLKKCEKRDRGAFVNTVKNREKQKKPGESKKNPGKSEDGKEGKKG